MCAPCLEAGKRDCRLQSTFLWPALQGGGAERDVRNDDPFQTISKLLGGASYERERDNLEEADGIFGAEKRGGVRGRLLSR